jgi:hypothetical protein
LPQVVLALAAPSCFSGRLDRWKQQRHQNADNSDHYE